MAFVEAFRQFQFRVGRDNFCSIHVSLVPQPNATGEHKTKPTQASLDDFDYESLSLQCMFVASTVRFDYIQRLRVI